MEQYLGGIDIEKSSTGLGSFSMVLAPRSKFHA